MSMRGRPLTTVGVALQLIGATTTETGLKVTARLDDGQYDVGRKLSLKQRRAVSLQRNGFHGEWNYTIHPVPVSRTEAGG